MGLEARIAPLFDVKPLDWEPPDPAKIDAVILTSANGARYAGPAAGAFLDHRCYAVGPSTAAAARYAGFSQVRTGPSDAAALLELAFAEGIVRALHLCGQDHVDVGHPGLELVRRPVYRSEAVGSLPSEAITALTRGAVALLHSARAAGTFAALVDQAELDRGDIGVAAISPAALEAAGPGWRLASCSPEPRDEALLELAAKLCQR